MSASAGMLVIRQGYLKKLKSMKKKYFVLLDAMPGNPARLEYYDSEKKWKTLGQPKKTINVSKCFNITRRLDTRHKYVFAMYTHEECLSMVADDEETLAGWLASLLELLYPGSAQENLPHPRHHIWQVHVQKKGLGASRNIVGLYNLCLRDKSLSLVKIRTNPRYINDTSTSNSIEYSLNNIRRCGDSECFFYMEVGRSSVTGAGELWMHTEDPNIAQSMHETILHAMSNYKKEELQPVSRVRSSSANEASKPISVLARRQTHTGAKSHGLSPSSESAICSGRSCVGLCISPCENASAAYCAPQCAQAGPVQGPPQGEPAPPPAGCPEEVAGLSIVHERTRSLPLAGDERERERPAAGGARRWQKALAPSRRASTGWQHQHPYLLGSVLGAGVGGVVRERCDSLPSARRAVGQREAGEAVGLDRPHSTYIRGLSRSPPTAVANSPLSPNSGAAYSTDSAGSSISIDETDSFCQPAAMGMGEESCSIMGRLMNIRKPDERSIPEEAGDECLWQPDKCLPESVEKGIGIPCRKTSTGGLPEMSSPLPISGTSPHDSTGYMPMSPASSEPTRMMHSRAGCNSSNHSRTSSLAEEVVDGSLVAPKTEDGYVDMEPPKESSRALSSAASTCSVTSGTPSTDLRFSEFHLEKVSSYFAPSEESEENRPARAYSVGSRPDHIKKILSRPDPHATSESARKRAFSVGSRSKTHRDNRILHHGTPPHSHLQHLKESPQHHGTKSNSAPVLAGTPRHAYNSTHSSVEPLDDLMEMDFSNRTRSPAPVPTKDMPPPPAPLSVSRSSQLSLPVPQPAPKPQDSDGYMDMCPAKIPASYLEMKPAEQFPPDSSIPKLIPGIVRKVSITKSPPLRSSDITSGLDSLHLASQSSTPDGYVEMSFSNTNALNTLPFNRNRISSLPIAINTHSPKDFKDQAPLSASPIFNMSAILKEDNPELKSPMGTPPKASSGISPVMAVTPSPFSSLKRNKKYLARRNSKELVTPVGNQSQTIFEFSLNSPGSPIKPFSPKAPLAVSEIPGRKCPVDASSGTLRLSHLSNVEDSIPETNPAQKCIPDSQDAVSVYMEMGPSRLSTVKEINESTIKSSVDKDMKQLINKATKVSGSAMAPMDEYIMLSPDPRANKSSKHHFMQQKSVDELSTHHQMGPNKPFLDLTYSTAKPPNGSQSISGSKVQNVPRKISLPVSSINTSLIRNTDANSKENQGILSSNPMANKTMMANHLTKSNINITNINQGQIVKKPILVFSQSQAITANFKPISSDEMSEPRGTKSSSPKLVESLLNRQLAGTHYSADNKCKSRDSEGYDGLAGQKLSLSRPSPVNSKCKKGNGGSGGGSRPPSVNSSRPSSVSSELGGGTPGGSRPGSVAGERENHGQCRLHYASLELEPERSPRPPTTPQSMAPAFTYAQIDFAKSEELKNSKNLLAKSKN